MKEETICWSCSNYLECKWVNEGKPVKGWTAQAKKTGSYCVYDCPNFSDEPRKPTTIDDNGAKALAAAILITGGKDYEATLNSLEGDNLLKAIVYNEESLPRTINTKLTLERFFCENFYRDILELDSTYIVESAKDNHDFNRKLESEIIPYKRGVQEGHDFAEREHKERSPLQRQLKDMEEKHEQILKENRRKRREAKSER